MTRSPRSPARVATTSTRRSRTWRWRLFFWRRAFFSSTTSRPGSAGRARSIFMDGRLARLLIRSSRWPARAGGRRARSRPHDRPGRIKRRGVGKSSAPSRSCWCYSRDAAVLGAVEITPRRLRPDLPGLPGTAGGALSRWGCSVSSLTRSPCGAAVRRRRPPLRRSSPGGPRARHSCRVLRNAATRRHEPVHGFSKGIIAATSVLPRRDGGVRSSP